MKVAIFVEGQTELIFVREYLLRKYEYEINIECRTLYTDSDYKTTKYDYLNPSSTFLVSIINVGNDVAVLSRIKYREKYMWQSGYDKILGLRDMYSKQYRESSITIDDNITTRFIDGFNNQISKMLQPAKIKFYFAIMEIEAWFLALTSVLEKIDNRLTVDFILTNLNIDLNSIDPEKEFFQPSETLDKIYKLIDKGYKKKEDDVEAILSKIEKEDYQDLNDIFKCNSFSKFFSEI